MRERASSSAEGRAATIPPHRPADHPTLYHHNTSSAPGGRGNVGYWDNIERRLQRWRRRPNIDARPRRMTTNHRRRTPPPTPVKGGARARRPPVIYELSAGGTSHSSQCDWATTDRGGVSLCQDRAGRERFTSLAHKIRILNRFGGPYSVPVVLILIDSATDSVGGIAADRQITSSS